MTKLRMSKVTVKLPDYVVKELDKQARNEKMSRIELIRRLFEIDFGGERHEENRNNNEINNVTVSFSIPEDIATYVWDNARNLGIGYTTYARHYLEKKLGMDFT